MTKKLIVLSLCASTTLFGQSELEELRALLDQQMKATAALQQRVVQLEAEAAESKKIAQKEEKAKKEAKVKKEKKVKIAQKQKEKTVEAAVVPKVETVKPRESASVDTLALNDDDDLSVDSTPTGSSSATFDQKSFLPDIALILDGSAVGRNVDNSTYETYYTPGFSSYDPNEEKEIPFNKNRGFNFNYAELALFSTVGPYFDATAIFHLHPDEFEIEEAYITSRSLPYGLRAKAGKFRSEFGRINSIHQHAWHFTQQPLVFESLLGSEGINDAGAQLQWVLPTDTYVMAGVEALQGNNDVSFGDIEKNNLYIGYLKSSIDLSDTTTLLAGASVLHGKNIDAKSTNIYGVDLTIKSVLDSYSSLMWQTELLYRDQSLQSANEKQAGYYTQLIYQYNQNWSVGARYDSIFKNLDTEPDDLDRYTAMLEYKPFEFSKFRLQYVYDQSKVFGIDDQRQDISEILLGFTIEAGAHGAHAF